MSEQQTAPGPGFDLEEWCRIVASFYREAGFEVTSVEGTGFPVVKTPPGLHDKVRLLKLRPPSVPLVRSIYMDGVLCTPEPLDAMRLRLDQLDNKKN